MTPEIIKAKIAEHQARIDLLTQQIPLAQRELEQHVGAVSALGELLPPEAVPDVKVAKAK